MMIHTEMRNSATSEIDVVSTLEMVRLINAEDAKVAAVVERELAAIAQAIDAISERMRQGGRLIYIGAGTSGRLGVLDASECPPTYNTPRDLVIGLMAGGDYALRNSLEDVEDNAEAGANEMVELQVNALDSLVGIAASGRTPYTMGAMRAARQLGALVISLACNHPSPMSDLADITIAPQVGPEAISGSTRMKAGTAQKMVLNMLSTGVMVRLGKTFGNLMVDMRASNRKLRQRAVRIVAQATGLTEGSAQRLLDDCEGEVKTAILCELCHLSPQVARERLSRADGVVRQAILDMQT